MISYNTASSFKKLLPSPSSSPKVLPLPQFQVMFVPPEFSQLNPREGQIDSRKWKTIVFPRMLCIEWYWHFFLGDKVWKLTIPYSSTKIHVVVCDMITASTVQRTFVAKILQFTSLHKLFSSLRVKHESLWKSFISIFCNALIELNGTELNFWLQKTPYPLNTKLHEY